MVLAIIVVAAYALTPFIVTRVAPKVAERYGIDVQELEIGYPRWHQVDIERFVMATDHLKARGEQVRVGYSLSALFAGRIDTLDIGSLEILLPSATTSNDVTARPDIDALFPVDRIGQIDVEHLFVTFPDTGFIGEGQANLGDGLLKLTLDGVAPELASNFSFTVDLSRQGLFDLRFGERQNRSSEFLRVTGQIANDTIGLNGSVNLSGLPLQLISELADVPQGSGTVSGTVQTRLPWPLPDRLEWQDLVATVPTFSIDWTSARNDFSLKLDAVSGSAELQRGEVEATVTGDLDYRIGDREFSAQLPAPYRFQYTLGTLRGAAGPRLTMIDPTTSVAAVLHGFSVRREPVFTVEVEADIDARIDGLHTTGNVRSALVGDALNLEGVLTIKNEVVSPQGILARLSSGAGTLQAAVRTRLPSPLPDTLTWQDLTATVSSYSVDWLSDKGDLQLSGLKGAAQFSQGDVDATVAGRARYRQSEQTINVRFPKSYPLKFEKNTLTGGRGLQLSLNEDRTNAVATLRSFSLRASPAVRLTIDADVDASVGASRTTGQLKARVTVDDRSQDKATGRVDYTGVVQAASQRYEGRLSTTVRANGDRLAASGALSTGLFQNVPLTLDYNMRTGAGQLQATHTLEFRNSITAGFFPDWSAPYDLDAGRIDAELRLKRATSGATATDLTAKLSNGQAHYGDFLATGIQGTLNFRADNGSNLKNWRLEPAVLRAERITAGIALNEPMVAVAWSDDEVVISEASTLLLGGRATAAPFVYTLSTGSTAFSVRLEDIDLGAVLALEGDDVTGTGSLSGYLPIRIEGGKPRIEAGLLSAAEPGGILQLSPTLTAPGGAPDLTFALNALRDFRYTELTAGIDYAESGDLTLAVHLKGHNPAVEKGRAIHYNLNITENVPILLESLRLTNKLNENLEQRLKQ